MPKSTISISILWLLISAVLFYAILSLVLFFNLFSWKFKLDTPVYIDSLLILVLIIANYFLAKHTVGKAKILVSFTIAFALMVFGFYSVYGFYSETITTGVFARSVLSPPWFRLLIFTLYLTPIMCWLIFPYKQLKKLSTHVKIN